MPLIEVMKGAYINMSCTMLSLLKPLFLEEEPWKYVDVIVSGIQSDLSQDKLIIHIPAEKIIQSTDNCEGLHDSHL